MSVLFEVSSVHVQVRGCRRLAATAFTEETTYDSESCPPLHSFGVSP